MTLTLEQKFGKDGLRGAKGEQLFYDYAIRTYDEVYWYQDDMKEQVKGVDFKFKKSSWRFLYSADIKANLKGRYTNNKYEGKFVVEGSKNGWLKNSKKTSNRIIHIDVENKYYLEYSRDVMKAYLASTNKELIFFNTSDTILNELNVKQFSIARKLRQPIIVKHLSNNSYYHKHILLPVELDLEINGFSEND